MKICHATLKSASPYSSSRAHDTEKLSRETPDAYEERTWKEKGHYLPDGTMFIPPMAFKMSLDRAAKMLGVRIPGKSAATYTKFFASGILVLESPPLVSVTRDTVAKDRIHANADGVRGSGKRVWKNFPRVDNWEITVDFHIIADEITDDIFLQHLKQAGAFVGVGRFRPENAGYYGRFKVVNVSWTKS